MIYYTMNPRYKKTSSGQTMTVILDLNNSDPTQWATYADDAINMEVGSNDWDTFFGHYPCILDNGVELGKLKRSDFTQYEDGTSAPFPSNAYDTTTLGKDVMICFPRRGIKLEYLDANTLSVSMTDEPNKTGFSYMAHSYSNSSANLSHAVCDKFYLGAFKGGTVQDGSGPMLLYSRATLNNQTWPSNSKTIGEFRTYAQGRGTGYEQSGFFQLTFRQVMYLLKYKGQNAQIAIGRGYVDGNSDSHYLGGTKTRGMDWGESTGKDQMKLFGLEDFYGNVWEFIDGVYSNGNRQIYVADGNFNDTGSGYTDAGTQSFGLDINGYLRYPAGTNLAGFNGGSQTLYGDETTYFCDSNYVADSRVAAFGGRWSNGSTAGVFSLYMHPSGSTSGRDVCSRLMYMHPAS